MSRRSTQDGASLHRFLPLFNDPSSPTPPHPVSHAAVTSWNNLPLPSDLPPKVLDLTHIRLNADPSECEKISVEAHSQLTKCLADCIARAPNLRVNRPIQNPFSAIEICARAVRRALTLGRSLILTPCGTTTKIFAFSTQSTWW